MLFLFTFFEVGFDADLSLHAMLQASHGSYRNHAPAHQKNGTQSGAENGHEKHQILMAIFSTFLFKYIAVFGSFGVRSGSVLVIIKYTFRVRTYKQLKVSRKSCFGYFHEVD